MNSSPGEGPDEAKDPTPRLFGLVGYHGAFVALLTSNALFRLVYTTLVPLTSDELMHWQWARQVEVADRRAAEQ